MKRCRVDENGKIIFEVREKDLKCFKDEDKKLTKKELFEKYWMPFWNSRKHDYKNIGRIEFVK